MSGAPNDRVWEVFAAVRVLPAADRGEHLQQLCGADARLHGEVESLLRYAEDSRDFLGTNQVEALVQDRPNGLPARIGQYEIVGKVAEGGMSIIYEALQRAPRRRVALKVLRAPLASESVRHRFAYEAAVLGRLQHPGIAQIYEAGTFDLGVVPQLFLTMEFVEGPSLTTWAAEASLDVRARLQLLASVCDAAQHAHQHGVIHRDLKPDNIVVDPTGQPKILDFGIACAVDERERTAGGNATLSGEAIGTPAYMSPEQIAGRRDEVAITSDVYALGVICYELLVGVLPHDLTGKSIAEAAALVNEQKPRPLGQIDARLRGDIDVVVGKALASDRARRYQSAAEMAVDLRLFLEGRPIVARAPSTLYQVSKFVQRNKALVGVTCLGLTAVVVGGALAAVAAVDLAAEREVADVYAYRVGVRAALDAIDRGRLSMARSLLDRAPQRVRGWEWQHVASRAESWTDELLSGCWL